MALESPLFQSSMELLGHSITHFNGTAELDRKLVILHLANAVELILKDMLLDLGESIYKNPKETVTVTGCIETLKNKDYCIPHINKIELLLDERNALQHRFGSPNELTSIFYMNIADDFFKEVLKEFYGKDLDEILPQFADETDLLFFRMRRPRNETELENLKKLSKVHPLGALLSAMNHLEGRIADFATNIGLIRPNRIRPPWAIISHRYLARNGIKLPEDLELEMNEVLRIRNAVAHGHREPSKDEANKCINAVERFERFLAGVDREKAKAEVERSLEAEEESRGKPLTQKSQESGTQTTLSIESRMKSVS